MSLLLFDLPLGLLYVPLCLLYLPLCLVYVALCLVHAPLQPTLASAPLPPRSLSWEALHPLCVALLLGLFFAPLIPTPLGAGPLTPALPLPTLVFQRPPHHCSASPRRPSYPPTPRAPA